MDVDAFAFIKLGPGSSVIKTEAVNTGASNGYNQIVYDHQQLEELAPAVYVAETFSGVEASVGYSGAARLMATGESVCAAWLATSTGKWRHYDTGGVTLTQLSFSATRLPAYITPE
jgi:cytochrome b involved in lipid metabolism